MVQSLAREREREVVRGRLPAARRDRRPALAALAVLLILLGALGSALIAFRSGDRVSVLVANDDITIGQQVEASDFRTVKVAGDTSNLVSASSLRSYIGTHALVGVPARTFVNSSMFSAGRVVPSGAEEVGIVVNADQRPGRVPEPGDVVKVYYVDSGAATSGVKAYNPGDQIVDAVQVIGVSSGGSGAVRNVTVLAKRSDAGILAALSATNNLALTLLPAETKPDVALASSGG